MPKVSVIMPVYGVEKYVAKAIESILSQTLTDFEFLIVDDGSKDNSGAICDAYAARDNRIHVIHKENGGAPSARNTAIKVSTGEYLYFMDSDDWAEPDMLGDMVMTAEQYQAQLVVAGFYIDTYFSDTEYTSQEISAPTRAFATQREFRENAYRLFDANLLYTPWNKLYRGDYIRNNGLTFPNTFWDDFPFNVSVLRDIERVVVTGKEYYHFIRARAESETAKYQPKMYEKREEEHGWLIDLYRYWQVDNAESLEMIARRYVERLVGCVENVTNDECTLSPKEKKAAIRAMLRNERVSAQLRLARPRSTYMKCMLLPIRWKSTHLTYREGRLISYVKYKNKRLFTFLKAKR